MTAEDGHGSPAGQKQLGLFSTRWHMVRTVKRRASNDGNESGAQTTLPASDDLELEAAKLET